MIEKCCDNSSSNIIEGIKAVFFMKRFHLHKKYKKHKRQINKFHSDVLYTHKKHQKYKKHKKDKT